MPDTATETPATSELVPAAPELGTALEQVEPLLDNLGLDRTQFVTTLITQIRDNPDLAKCTPDSFVAAVYKTARLRLRTGDELGWCWLIPRRIKGVWQVTWMLGYKGMQELARRADIKIRTGAVYAADEFEVQEGTAPSITHRHGPRYGQGDAHTWYATAEFSDGTMMFRVLTKPQVEARRKLSSSQKGDKPSGFWAPHGYDRMARKTCIRALDGDLPKGISPEMADAAAADGTVVRLPARTGGARARGDRTGLPDPTVDDDTPDVEVVDDTQAELDEALVANIAEWRQAAGLDSDQAWAAWIAAHCQGAESVDDLDTVQARGLLDATRNRAQDGEG